MTARGQVRTVRALPHAHMCMVHVFGVIVTYASPLQFKQHANVLLIITVVFKVKTVKCSQQNKLECTTKRITTVIMWLPGCGLLTNCSH